MYDKAFKIAFTLSTHGCLFRYVKDSKSIFEANFNSGFLSVAIHYTANERPLILRTAAEDWDTVELTVYPWRIELAIGGVTVDEEWPFGETYLEDCIEVEKNVSITELPIPEKKELPNILGSFEGGEGWRPGNGIYVGDCMPYADGDRYHVLYLKDRHHHRSKWHKGAHQWEHISSADLKHWDIHPMVVEITDSDEGSICTGSWMCEGGKHQLYYTVRMSDGSSAPICRSISNDGFHYEKDRDFRFTLSEKYRGSSARDPKIVRGEDGILHMFVTTTNLESGKGCLVHLTSKDGDCWTEIGDIYTGPDADEPECSDYFRFGGKYYLIFSHHGTAQYRISDKPFTDWQTPSNPHIPCEAVPKAAIWNDRIIFTGFKRIGGYAGTLTFMEANIDENGELVFINVKETQN